MLKSKSKKIRSLQNRNIKALVNEQYFYAKDKVGAESKILRIKEGESLLASIPKPGFELADKRIYLFGSA